MNPTDPKQPASLPSLRRPERRAGGWLRAGIMVLLCGASVSAADPSGLLCSATDGRRSIVFAVPAPGFTLKPDESLHPQLGPAFRAEWSGFLRVPRAGRYTLRGEARIRIGDIELTNAPVHLNAGDLPLRIEFSRLPGPARLQLWWESEFFSIEPLPASALTHRAAGDIFAPATQLARGRALAESLRCAACHVPAQAPLRAQPARPLTLVGERANAAWLFHWLAGPHPAPGVTHPLQLRKPQDRADAAAYLAQLKSGQAPNPKLAGGNAAAGRTLFTSIGCTACHNAGDRPLDGLGSKFTAVQAALWLSRPANNPEAHSPDFNLKTEEARDLGAFLAASRRTEFETPPPAGNAARGRALVAAGGCLNCHPLADPALPAARTVKAAAFAMLRPDQGCLAVASPQSAPDFRLAAADRTALAAFIRSPDVSTAPVQDFARRVETLRCAACHEWHGPPKVEQAPQQSPPPLTIAGNKLRTSWAQKVLLERKRVRPWLALRMPHYRAGDVAEFPELLATQVGAEPGDGPRVPPPSLALVRQGVALLGRGEGGLSCIACHDFRGAPAGGDMHGPDLIEMDDRIRADWLERWLRDPARLISGTAMPQFFADQPAAAVAEKINRITAALAAGRTMPAPEGLNEESHTYLLTVRDEPVLFRGFLTEVSPRTIAIGLPGGLSYAFDAEACQLRLAWAGEFLDARPTWHGRGAGPAKILGDTFHNASRHPLRVGSRTEDPKIRFRGYELVNRTPVFIYELNGASVRLSVRANVASEALQCSYEIEHAPGPVWFQAAPSTSVAGGGRPLAPGADGWIAIPHDTPVKFSVVITRPAARPAAVRPN